LPPEHWAAEFTGALGQVLKHAQRNYYSRLVETAAAGTPAELAEQTRAKLQQTRRRDPG